ncbi:hypothetical protein COOONC_15412 [Cooperia oncophora]
MGDEARGGVRQDSDEELSSDDELQQELCKLAGIKKDCVQKRRQEKPVKSEFEMDMECELDQLITDYANEHLSGNIKRSGASAATRKELPKIKEVEMPALASYSDEENESETSHDKKEESGEQCVPTKRVRLEVVAETKTLPKVEEMETDTVYPGSSSASQPASIVDTMDSSPVKKGEPGKGAKDAEKPAQEEAEDENPIKKAARQTMKDVKAELPDFYDPDEDDQNEKWMQQQRKRNTGIIDAGKTEKEAR